MKKLSRTLVALLLVGCGYVVLVAIPREAINVERVAVTGSPADLGLAFEKFVVSPGTAS